MATDQPPSSVPMPTAFGLGNFAMDWGGTRPTSITSPLIPPETRTDSQERSRMMFHELFHRIQPDLGFMTPDVRNRNAHLDTLDGRYWLQLEWRALSRALTLDAYEQSNRGSSSRAGAIGGGRDGSPMQSRIF